MKWSLGQLLQLQKTHKAQQRPQHESFLAYAKPTTAGSGTGAYQRQIRGFVWKESIPEVIEKKVWTTVIFYVVVGTFFLEYRTSYFKVSDLAIFALIDC